MWYRGFGDMLEYVGGGDGDMAMDKLPGDSQCACSVVTYTLIKTSCSWSVTKPDKIIGPTGKHVWHGTLVCPWAF